MIDIKDRLMSAITESVGKSIFENDEDHDRMFDELGLDSLDVMAMFLEVQECFGLPEIPGNELEGLMTLNTLTQYITNKQ
jgi:acyl carrier protein